MDVFQAQLEVQKNGICYAMLMVVEAEGTSAFHIYQHHKAEIGCSERRYRITLRDSSSPRKTLTCQERSVTRSENEKLQDFL